jgi:ketosteroid isomerase-like protein
MKRMKRGILVALSATAIGVLAAGAHGQLLLDGDMEALSIGTPPDCDAAAAGAWAFPDTYAAAALCEPDPSSLRIESDPGGRGNSLLMKISDTPGAETNVHLPNLLTRVVMAGEGIVTVQFDIYVAGGAAGGAVYVGGDHGGGGYSFVTDRGPQLLWASGGQLIAFDSAGVRTPIAEYESDVWQRVVLEIDLVSDTFSAYHTNDVMVAPALVADDLSFRSPTQDFLDRFTFAHFGATELTNVAFLDNVSVEVDSSGCYADCDESGELDFFDFLCFQDAFAAGEPYADCDGSGELDFFDFLCFQDEFAAGCP